MVLGSVSCPIVSVEETHQELRTLKQKYGVYCTTEVKWTKVSPAKIGFYQALVDYFFQNANLSYRGIIIPKSILEHDKHHQDHETFYYKMWYVALKAILNCDMYYNIYLDIQNTHCNTKIQLLRDILNTKFASDCRERVLRLQAVRSQDVGLIQLADLLTGAISYANRDLNTSKAKMRMVERIQELSNLTLTSTTGLTAKKVNILRWCPRS